MVGFNKRGGERMNSRYLFGLTAFVIGGLVLFFGGVAYSYASYKLPWTLLVISTGSVIQLESWIRFDDYYLKSLNKVVTE